MNADSIASVYRWLEYLAFGRALERCRSQYLDLVKCRRRALFLGDGDGRFLASFLRTSPDAYVDTVDTSEAMLTLSRRRIDTAFGGAARVHFVHLDARTFVPMEKYDLIVSHFFLDCLEEREIDGLAARLRQTSLPRVHWLVSEFRVPDGFLAGTAATLLLRVMYEFFAQTTGLRVRQLPDHRRSLERHGFRLSQEHRSVGGLLVSELWVSD